MAPISTSSAAVPSLQVTELGQHTWPEAESGPRTLLVPLGSTEQHGPHLPLSTDTLIAEAWCRAVAAQRDDVVVAPALPYGSSGEHQDFAGTLSMGTDALTSVLVELGRSAMGPMERLVFVNGHGGNHLAVTAAVQLLRSESRNVLAAWPQLPAADAHAGHTETSLMLVIAPHLVRPELAEEGNTVPIAQLVDELRQDGMRAHAPNGVLGDPTAATAEHGEELLALLADQLHALLNENEAAL